jgi:hypothetical protein
MMGTEYLDSTLLVRQPDGKARPAAATPAARSEGRYYAGATVTVLAALALMATPALVALLAITGIVR